MQFAEISAKRTHVSLGLLGPLGRPSPKVPCHSSSLQLPSVQETALSMTKESSSILHTVWKEDIYFIHVKTVLINFISTDIYWC